MSSYEQGAPTSAEALEQVADRALEEVSTDPNVGHWTMLKSKEGDPDPDHQLTNIREGDPSIVEREDQRQVTQELRAIVHAGSNNFAVTKIRTASHEFYAVSLVGEEGQRAQVLGYLSGEEYGGDSVSVGRKSAGSSGLENDPLLSREHFSVMVHRTERGDVLNVIDAASSNGTIVARGRRVEASPTVEEAASADERTTALGGLKRVFSRKRQTPPVEGDPSQHPLSESERWMAPLENVMNENDKRNYHRKTSPSLGGAFSS